MSSFALMLIFCSVFMHAGWNLLARRQGAEAAFFGRMLLVSAIVGFVPGVVSEALTGSINPSAWACVAGSGVCCGLYYVFLARAYRSADFTIVYPVARSLPVILVGLADVLRGRQVTPLGWLGMSVLVCGCALVPLRSVKDIAWKRYVNRSTLWMLLTALGTVGYTVLDKIGAETVEQGPATAARYGYFFFLISWMTYAVAGRGGVRQTRESMPAGWLLPFLGSVMNFGAYWLVLWAYQLTDNAGYVVAFRQLSIVIGVIVAFVVFREHGVAIRLTGTALVTAGLILIQLCG